jgi:hypothetical protein
MPASVVTFTDFNLDPLPPASLFSSFAITSVTYGTVVGGAGALNTKDGDASYVQVGTDTHSGIASMVTCRPVVTPSIPGGASFALDLPTRELDFAAFQMQVRYLAAPTMPPHGSGLTPISPDWEITQPSSLTVTARSIADGRDSADPAWSSTYWDETDCGSTAGLPAFNNAAAIAEPGFVAYNPDGYMVIWTPGPDVLISQIVGQITWTLGTELKTVGRNFRSASGVQISSLVPGAGWVPVQRFG